MEQKPKRKLKSIDFSGTGSHIALVSKDQGGPANGANYALVLKNVKNPSESFIEKASMIQVTMTIPEYLERFYSIWGSDACVLAKIFGFDVEEPESDFDYDSWIEERVKSVTIMKSLKDAKSLPEALAVLSEDDYLSILQDQQVLEKALEQKEFDAQKSSGTDTSNSGEVMKEVSTSKINKGKKKMTVEKDLVERSQLESVEKAFSEQKQELLKAQELIAQFQAEKKEAIVKSKTDAVQAVLQDEKTVAVVMKAALALEAQEDFDALVAVLKGLKDEAAAEKQKVEKSDLFKEIGATVDAEEKPQESKLTQLIKSKYPTK